MATARASHGLTWMHAGLEGRVREIGNFASGRVLGQRVAQTDTSRRMGRSTSKLTVKFRDTFVALMNLDSWV